MTNFYTEPAERACEQTQNLLTHKTEWFTPLNKLLFNGLQEQPS